jgi:hypothetical protein
MDINELSKNKHKISEPYVNEEGQTVRIVDGKEIIQIEEKTPYDKRLNEAINLWRMRRK